MNNEKPVRVYLRYSPDGVTSEKPYSVQRIVGAVAVMVDRGASPMTTVRIGTRLTEEEANKLWVRNAGAQCWDPCYVEVS